MANSENILGHNLSFGSNTCFMDTGAEYQDISPTWTYYTLPGTISIFEEDDKLATYDDDDFKPTKCEGPFFCGEKDGVAFCMQKACHAYRDGTETKEELPHDKLHYMITCFATNNGMVILGSNISFDGTTDAMKAVVENCIWPGLVEIKSDNRQVTRGSVVYKDIDPNTTSQFEVEHKDVTKSWHRNKTSYAEGDVATNKMLGIVCQSDNPSKYAYSIQPKSKADAFTFVVACNDEKIHAIDIGNNKLAVACYEPGTFNYDGQDYTISQKGYSVIEKKS